MRKYTLHRITIKSYRYTVLVYMANEALLHKNFSSVEEEKKKMMDFKFDNETFRKDFFFFSFDFGLDQGLFYCYNLKFCLKILHKLEWLTTKEPNFVMHRSLISTRKSRSNGALHKNYSSHINKSFFFWIFLNQFFFN